MIKEAGKWRAGKRRAGKEWGELHTSNQYFEADMRSFSELDKIADMRNAM